MKITMLLVLVISFSSCYKYEVKDLLPQVNNTANSSDTLLKYKVYELDTASNILDSNDVILFKKGNTIKQVFYIGNIANDYQTKTFEYNSNGKLVKIVDTINGIYAGQHLEIDWNNILVKEIREKDLFGTNTVKLSYVSNGNGFDGIVNFHSTVRQLEDSIVIPNGYRKKLEVYTFKLNNNHNLTSFEVKNTIRDYISGQLRDTSQNINITNYQYNSNNVVTNAAFYSFYKDNMIVTAHDSVRRLSNSIFTRNNNTFKDNLWEVYEKIYGKELLGIMQIFPQNPSNNITYFAYYDYFNLIGLDHYHNKIGYQHISNMAFQNVYEYNNGIANPSFATPPNPFEKIDVSYNANNKLKTLIEYYPFSTGFKTVQRIEFIY